MKIDFTGSEMNATDAMMVGDEYFLSLSEQKPKPELIDTAAAAWKLYNPLSSYVEDKQLREAYGGAEGFTSDQEYNVYDTLEDQYWDDIDQFINVTSPQEAEYVKASINSQYRNAQTIDESGWTGVAMTMGAGALDPILAPLALLGGAGVGAARGALRGAAIATAEMGVQETMLHSTQRTRTWQESMFAVGAAPVFGSVFGSIGGAMTKREITKEISQIQKTLDENNVNGGILKDESQINEGGSIGAAEAGQVGTLAEEQPIGFIGPAISPQLRLLKSNSRNFVNFINNTARHDMQIGKNMKVIEVPESKITLPDGTVETKPAHKRIEYQETGEVFEVMLVRDIHKQGMATHVATSSAYKNYIGSSSLTASRLRGRAGRGTMTYKQFRKEIGKAIRNGNESTNPHIKKAAEQVSKTLEDTKNRMIKAGMLPEDVKPKFALGYLSRVYDVKAIQSDRTGWDAMLKNHFMSKGMDEGDAVQAAYDTTNHIVVHGTNPINVKPSGGAPTKSRTLDIDDSVLAPYMLNDVETVMDRYMSTTMPYLHWQEKFGTTELDDLIQKGKDDYAILIQKEKDGKNRKRIIDSLEKQMSRDIQDIMDAQQLYLGSFNIPRSSRVAWTNASRGLRGLTTTANLGGMTISALPDASMAVFKNGLLNTATGFMQFITSFGKKSRAPRRAISEAGIATEMTLGSRVLSSTELEDVPPIGKALLTTFSNIALMGPWNHALKSVTAFAAQNRIYKTIMNYDKARPMRKSILASNGIGENTARAFKKELDKHAVKFRGGYDPQTLKWDNQALAKKWDDLIFGQTESTIVTPGRLDRPTAMNYETGKFLLMFKSFIFASHHQILLPLAQRLPQGDLQALNGILITGSLGMFVEWSKLFTSGRIDEIDNYTAQDWARAGVERSGWLSLPSDAISMTDRITGGRMANAIGLKEGSKYFYRNKADMLLGPAGGTMLGLMNAVGNLTSEDGMSASDIHGMRRILPYQNLFYTRWLFNMAEEALAQGRTDDRRRR